MRSIWKGSITFGLVSVPIKVYSATEDHDVSLHQVHDEDGGRIRYQRRCEVCNKVVDYEHIDKAYEDGETTVVLTAEDLKSLPEERSREIEVVEFVPSDQIDPIMLDRSYFLEPDERAVKPYVLLRRALEDTERTAIVQFSLRQKTRLGALRSRGTVLMLQSLLWDDEVREAAFPSLDTSTSVSKQELSMAGSLIENMASDFSPDQFSDAYQEQLRTLIDAKIAEGDSLDTAATFGEEPEENKGDADVIDLMAALRDSVERSRQKRTGSSSEQAASTTSTKKTPTKKAPTKKAPTKKAPTKKSAAKKSASAKKSAATKTGAKKAPAKKAPAKKTSAKKAPAKNAPARKAQAKKAS